MHYFTIAAVVAMAFSSTFATPLSSTTRSLRAEKWLSVESGISQDEVSVATNGTLSKRTGAQVVTCYNSGTAATRGAALDVIDDWCSTRAGQFVSPGDTHWARYNYGKFTIYLGATALSQCGGFPIDGACNRVLRLPVNMCNSNKGEYGKQGGYETDLCGRWRLDPGSHGSDH